MHIYNIYIIIIIIIVVIIITYIIFCKKYAKIIHIPTYIIYY